MHLAIALFIIYATWKWADWRNWKQYHASMFFIMAGGFLYEYLTKDFPMWVFHPDFLYNHEMTVIVYAIVTMPLNVLIFLSRYPQPWKKQITFIAMWIAVYGVENGYWKLQEEFHIKMAGHFGILSSLM
ncbi:CBO0543 family protein [Paenibacillus sp. V4I7]|uniref:CBO0543 family protein n=1 Tax=Paenibacillus sp. V4I7 TaxID=3042307 RepID=UPI00277EE9D3|nr:CBO0543 family protein [Paenibacillus sp. V4I7]MDQ0899316.1 succinate dehydrogenase hydrophobic anchor subunit [Paenibacillus sp. V4I7]